MSPAVVPTHEAEKLSTMSVFQIEAVIKVEFVNLQLSIRCSPDYAIRSMSVPLVVVTGLPSGLSLGVAVSGFHRYSGFAMGVAAQRG